MQIKDTEMMRLQIDRLIGSVFLDFYAISFILFLLSIFLELGLKKNIYIQQKPLVRLKVNLLVRFSNF